MRLLIVAEHTLAAEMIRRELRHVSGCEVLGYVHTRRASSLAITEARPDIILIDDRTNESVLDTVRQLRAGAPDATLVLLTTRMEPGWLAEASAAGVDAAVSKNVTQGSLGLLIREVAAGNVYHMPVAPPAAATECMPDVDLTARELEILREVAAGRSNGSIARTLWITEQTVKFHLSNIYRKLGVANRTEASHFAHVNGLLAPAPVRSIPLRSAA